MARLNLAVEGANLICRERLALGSSSVMRPIEAVKLQLGGVAVEEVEC